MGHELPAFKLKVLGTRGSVPVEGKDFALYGGATSCYQVQAGNEEIYLDAGSGIFGAKPSPTSRITLLLSHMHLDHLVGLPFFSALGEKGRAIDIYSDKHEGLTVKEAIDRLISPPFWPIKLESYPACVKFHDLSTVKERGAEFFIGDVAVDFMDSNHPNGSTIYKLTQQGKSFVYATDFEHSPESCAALANFAKGCDLLMYDAQYTAQEYEACKGFGHSTVEFGLKVAAQAGVAKLLFVHHAPNRTDEALATIEQEISARHAGVSFAKIDEEIFL